MARVVDSSAGARRWRIHRKISSDLASLISAYELSGDQLMLIKAEELARWILPAFGTKTGIPFENYQIGRWVKISFGHEHSQILPADVFML